jgi:hypothetical protein
MVLLFNIRFSYQSDHIYSLFAAWLSASQRIAGKKIRVAGTRKSLV